MNAEIHASSFDWFCPECCDGRGGFGTDDEAQDDADRHNGEQHTRHANDETTTEEIS